MLPLSENVFLSECQTAEDYFESVLMSGYKYFQSCLLFYEVFLGDAPSVSCIITGITSTPSVLILCPQNVLLLVFWKNMTFLNVGLLRMSRVFTVWCKIVDCWVYTNCFLMTDV
jgi:hypothetical protein